jgi:hypothetical protein
MELWLLSFAVLGLAFAAMALGVCLGRAPLRRGCGDAAGAACDACTRPCRRRGAAPARGPGG